MKPRYAVLSLISMAAVVGTLPFVLELNDESALLTRSVYETKYLHIMDGGDLHNGDFYTRAGTKLHFNEDGVTEDPLVIAPLGGIYLTTPINGMKNVEIDLYHHADDYSDNFTFAWCSAPYEAMDVFDGSRTGKKDFTNKNYLDLPPRYFSITNPSSTKSVRINSIAIRYECESNYNSIVAGPLEPMTVSYEQDEAPLSLDYSITGTNVDLDKFDRCPRGTEGHIYPGVYPVCFSVYGAKKDEEEEDDADKIEHAFQFSKLSSFSVRGMNNGDHALMFHNSLEHSSGTVVGCHDQWDFHGPFPEGNIWDTPINDFTDITQDRHYYPLMTAFGFDPYGHCSPVSANWHLNEGSVHMPTPDQIDAGYQFVAWYTNAGLTRPYDPNRTYDYHLTLYARIVRSDDPVRPIYYYDVDRNLELVDYVVLDQVNGDSHEGDYTVKAITDDAFYHNANDEVGYCKTGSIIHITEHEGPVTILTITDTQIQNTRDYHVEYRTETVTGDTFRVMTHFSDRKGYREIYDPQATEDHPFPSLPFHVQEGEEFHPITATSGYIYPYARRNTFLDDLDALTEIGPYAYACYSASSTKPLYGLRGHNRVTKVGRRAFFNRFGLADYASYFPANAVIFDTEAYANVFFNNNILMLPNSLQRIGARCFMGCSNIGRIYLPASLQFVGADAFSIGTFDESSDQFVNIHPSKRIDFYYQGSVAQYHALPESTRQRIEANARSITFDVTLHMHAATDFNSLFDCPYTQKYLPEEQEDRP